MRLVFMGTPEYAAASLRAVSAAGHEVVAALTQPARPRGRQRAVRTSPVAETARELGIEILTPEKPNRRAAVEAVAARRPEIILVVAYGALLGAKLLAIPPRGCVNAHGSLLPRHRGASPIAAAVRAGDAASGVTLIRLVRALDAGPILLRREVPLDPRETAGSLHEKLAQLSAQLLVEYLRRIEAGETIAGRAQDESQATYAPRLTKQDGRIDWSLPAVEIDRHVRAMDPWPGAFTALPGEGGEPLKIRSASVGDRLPAAGAGLLVGKPETGDRKLQDLPAAPGQVLAASAREGILVAAGEGAIRVESVQPPGKKPMAAAAFLRGHALQEGDVLGGSMG